MIHMKISSDQLHELKKHIYEIGKDRESFNHWGKDKSNGEPTKSKRGKELEFYIGAYTALTKMMAMLEDISLDEAMQYFDPIVTFSAIRGESITREFAKHRFSQSESKKNNTKYNNLDMEAK